MPLPDLSPASLRRDPRARALSTYRIHLLSELIDALEEQIEALITHGLPGAARHAGPVLLLAERLRGVQLLWEVLLLLRPGPLRPTPAELTIGSMSARDTCARLVRAAVVESSAVYPAAVGTGAGADREDGGGDGGRGAVLSFKTGVVEALEEARRRWRDALRDRVAAGFFDVDVDVDVDGSGSSDMYGCDGRDAFSSAMRGSMGDGSQGFTSGAWDAALDAGHEGLPRYEGPENGPPGYHATSGGGQGSSSA